MYSGNWDITISIATLSSGLDFFGTFCQILDSIDPIGSFFIRENIRQFFSICAQNISFVNMILYFTDLKITSSSVTIVNIIITIEAQKRMYDGTDM